MKVTNQSLCEISLVIPIYKSEASIERLVDELEKVKLQKAWEVIFIDDGSPDLSHKVLMKRLERSNLKTKVVQHTRNFGEHQAVLTGYRIAEGNFIINIDDDLQNPPKEAVRLYEYAKSNGLDVVYGKYRQKNHSPWRNFGSYIANLTANFLLDLPRKFYFSSFRCVRGEIGKAASEYIGPYPYIDGLLSQLTQSVGTIYVKHSIRMEGESGYNMRRLIRLWLNILTSFSLMPLRLSTFVGILMAISGFGSAVIVVCLAIFGGVTVSGWSSVICCILILGGIQLLILGIIGEYLGRILLTVNNKPQSKIRSILSSTDD